MTNDERKKKIMMLLAKAIIIIVFAASVVFAWNGNVWIAVVLPGLAVVYVFCNRLVHAVGLALFGIGLILHMCGQEALADGFFVLGFVILVGRSILNIRKMRAEVRKIKAQAELKSSSEEDTLKTRCPMTNEQRRRVKMFLVTEAICMLFLISGMGCLLYDKLVWAGILFVTVGAVNTFPLGLPVFNIFILVGLMLVSLGYERRELAMMFGVIGFAVITANTILMHRAIAGGALERLDKSNRFAFFDYLRENEITCILWNKLKRR